MSKPLRAIVALVALLSLTLAVSPAAFAQAAPAVTISDFKFTPQSVTVPVGTRVTWTNDGPSTHTATGSGVFDSGPLARGQSFSFTFSSPGAFNYMCTIHPFMTGVINVTAASAAPASAPASAAASPTPASAATSTAPAASAAPAPRVPQPAASPSTRAAGATGSSPAPVQVPSALPKTGEGGSSPSTPAGLWAGLAVAALLAAGLATRHLRGRT